MNGITLSFEGGYASGSFEDGHDGHWVAEARRGGVPYAEGTGENPLNAITALACVLDQLVSAERSEVALNRIDDAQVEALADMTPEQRDAIAAAKQRIADKRAARGGE